MSTSKPKYTYIEPSLIPDMPAEELLTRVNWLVETTVAKYCFKQDAREDALQTARYVILRDRPKFDPSVGTNFEGWVRLRVAIAVKQLNLNHGAPVHIPEKTFRKGDKVLPRYKHPATDLPDDYGCPEFADEDTQVLDRDTGVELQELYTAVTERIKGLPKDDREAVEAFLAAKPRYRGAARYSRAHELLPKLTSGLSKQAKELLLV